MMNQNYLLNFLKIEIQSNPTIQKERQLQSEIWKKSGFELASEIISQKLFSVLNKEEQLKWGFGVSSKTLTNIFKGEYKMEFPLDPRNLATLQKLSRFCDFDCWDTLLAKCENKLNNEMQNPKSIDFSLFIDSALNAHFFALKQDKDVAINEISKFFQLNTPPFNEILDKIVNSGGLTISNNYNPSTYALLENNVISLNENKSKIETKEYWMLCWWNPTTSSYTKRDKEIYNNTYFVEKQNDNSWRIINKIQS